MIARIKQNCTTTLWFIRSTATNSLSTEVKRSNAERHEQKPGAAQQLIKIASHYEGNKMIKHWF